MCPVLCQFCSVNVLFWKKFSVLSNRTTRIWGLDMRSSWVTMFPQTFFSIPIFEYWRSLKAMWMHQRFIHIHISKTSQCFLFFNKITFLRLHDSFEGGIESADQSLKYEGIQQHLLSRNSMCFVQFVTFYNFHSKYTKSMAPTQRAKTYHTNLFLFGGIFRMADIDCLRIKVHKKSMNIIIMSRL